MYKTLLRAWLPGVAVHVGLGLAVLSYYLVNGGTRWEALPIHAFLLIACFCLLLAFWAAVIGVTNSDKRSIKVLFLASHVALSGWVILIHLSSATGFFIWSDQVSIQALINYLPTMTLIAGEAGMDRWLVLVVTGSLALTVITLWMIWSAHLNEVFSVLKKQRYTKKQVAVGALLVAIASTSLWGFKATIQNERMKSLRSEPFSNYFRTPSAFSLSHQATSIGIEADLEARESFRTAAKSSVSSEELPNVVLIMLDAARADRMSVYGYERQTTPFLDSLEDSGYLTKASFATSTCTASVCGITTTLSSRFVTRIHYLNYKLHDALRDIGYDTHFFLSGDHSAAYSNLRWYYGNELDTFKDGFWISGQHPSDDEVALEHLKDSEGLQDCGPCFVYIHLMSSHYGGKKYEQFEGFGPVYQGSVRHLIRLVRRNDEHEIEPETIERLINGYDSGMLQADDYVRRIFRVLRARGVLEDSIVVITSDHGESLGEGGRLGHGGEVQMAEINIPMLFYSENVTSLEQEIPYATLIDVGPTVLGLLQMRSPKTWAGKNLFADTRSFSYHMSQGRDGNNGVVLEYEGDMYLYSRDRSTGDERLVNVEMGPYQSSGKPRGRRVKSRGRELYEEKFGD